MDVRSVSLPEWARHYIETLHKTAAPLPLEAWEPVEKAAALLCAWRASKHWVKALLATPCLNSGTAGSQELIHAVWKEQDGTSEALERLRVWNSEYLALLEATAGPNESSCRALCSALFRHGHIDPAFGIVLLADRVSRLCYRKRKEQTVSLDILQEAEFVLIPVAEMFSLWKLRQYLLEDVLQAQEPKKYQGLASVLGDESLYSLKRMQELVEQGVLDSASDDLPKEFWKKARACLHIEKSLREAAKKEKLVLHIEPRYISPAVMFRKAVEGESERDLVNRLHVKILCNSLQDCYHVLYLVHRLGRQSTSWDSPRFEDFIAAPQTHGYRALHTALVTDDVSVEFRILTKELEILNHYGAVAALWRAPKRYAEVPAWWNMPEKHRQDLRAYRYDCSDAEFLDRFAVGSLSEGAIYAFSPRGDVYILKAESTALDFAYKVHSDLGNHAVGIEINGKSVGFSHPLTNGDVVRVQYRRNAPGPDISWLSYVHMGRTREKIRQELLRQASDTHPGREVLEKHLIALLAQYKQLKNYEPTVVRAELEIFLHEEARDRSLMQLGELYEEIVAGDIDPKKLAAEFLAREIAAAIVDGGGMPFPRGRLVLCTACKPIPYDQLMAHVSGVSAKGLQLKVHALSSKRCRNDFAAAQHVAVRWAKEMLQPRSNYGLIRMRAHSRRHLMGDILNVVYEDPNTDLHEAVGKELSDNVSDVQLVVAVPSTDVLSRFQAKLEQVTSVHQVAVTPVSPIPSMLPFLLSTEVKDTLEPFSEGEVYRDRGFYGRRDELDQLTAWMGQEDAPPVMILHGQGRVGKSSLAKYLIYSELPKTSSPCVPVFVDFRGCDDLSTSGMTNFLMEAIYRELNLTPPYLAHFQTPVPKLQHALDKLVAKLSPSNLLVVIDEFTYAFGEFGQAYTPAAVFSNLACAMTGNTGVKWLIIMHDSHFYDPDARRVADSLLRQARHLPLRGLPRNWAYKMIEEPLTRSSMVFGDDRVVSDVADLTGGVPYLAKALCYQMCHRAQLQKRRTITRQDLVHATQLLLAEGDRYFNHLIDTLDEKALRVLTALAHYTEETEVPPNKSVVVKSAIEGSETIRDIEVVLGRLLVEGTVTEDSLGTVRISIPLFEEWLKTRISSPTPRQAMSSLTARHTGH